MKVNKTRGLIALLIIFQISFAGFCGKNESKARVLIRANDDIAQGQIEAADFLKNNRDSGMFSDEDVKVFKAILIDINGYNQKAIELGREILSNPIVPVDKQEQLLQIVTQASNAITRLNNAGLTRIKDPAKKAAFNAIVTTFQVAAATVITILVKKGN